MQLKNTLRTYNDLDQYRAKALIDTSMAGQISDMAQAIRYTEGTPAIEQIQEEILDRIEFLSYHKGRYIILARFRPCTFKGMGSESVN